VNFSANNFQVDQAIAATANTDLTFTNTTATYAINTTLAAVNGALRLTDSLIGDSFDFKGTIPASASTAAVKTRFTAEAQKAALILESITNSETGISADTIGLTAKTDVTLKGALITISPTDSLLGAFNITAKTGAVSVTNVSVKHSEVNITAGGDVIGPALSAGVGKGPNTKTLSELTDSTGALRGPTADQLKNIIDLNQTFFTNAQRVALDATTIVLKDVVFKAGSDVFLNSFYGKVAAKPGVAGIATAPGYVNFKTGVKYGDIGIVMPNAEQAMNHAAFQTAADAAFGPGALSKITIGYQTGNAKTVGRP